jgi:ABC-2 type transport system ATP-binding protein
MDWTSSHVIDTQGLSKAFNGTQALKALNLQVRSHSIFGFLGPNGAGKTTTIKILLGLIRPTGGRATVFGLDTVKDSVHVRARVGYLPQEPRFYDYLTARQTLRFAARFFFQGPAQAIEDRVDEMLKLVDLTSKADRPIRTFSGGERQRLGIAQAQVNHPDLLILDEPAASLDPLGRRDVLEVMSRLCERTTIFYSTHILDDVQRVSDTVAILNKGELVAQGEIEELLAGSDMAVYIVHLRAKAEATDVGAIHELPLPDDIEAARQRVLSMPWVQGITDGPQNGHVTWNVSVRDPRVAEEELLKLLVNDSVVVTEFRRKQADLEDVFMQVVEGANRVRH